MIGKIHVSDRRPFIPGSSPWFSGSNERLEVDVTNHHSSFWAWRCEARQAKDLMLLGSEPLQEVCCMQKAFNPSARECGRVKTSNVFCPKQLCSFALSCQGEVGCLLSIV